RVQFNEFPLAVHGDIGVLTHLQPINEPELLQHWDSNGGRGVFTFSTWIYLERSCDSSWCNILLGIDAENRHRSPGLLITKDNRLHYQGHHSNREDSKGSAFLSGYRLPLRTWLRIVLVWQPH
uniref:LAM_G_DOMAIN domain-containing protein n=1 Tax=Macrostomum lignano TaxID=282301 RepID=A0A1I8G0A4_9PLAT